MNAGQAIEAVAILAKFAARKPNEARALHLLGIASAMTGERQKAAQHLRQASALKPRSAGILTDLAAFLTSTKRDRESLASRKRDPDLLLAQFYTGVALANLARHREAIEVFEGLSAKDPFNVVYRAESCGAAGDRFDEADAIADELLATNPAMSELLMIKCVTATGRGKLRRGPRHQRSHRCARSEFCEGDLSSWLRQSADGANGRRMARL
jgi:tetratricopeptide (TPR) repeat protein